MYKVIGIKNVNYTSKQGFDVRGLELQCIYEDRRVQGSAVEKIYLSDRVLSESGIHAGDLMDSTIKVSYNRYGKPEYVQIGD